MKAVKKETKKGVVLQVGLQPKEYPAALPDGYYLDADTRIVQKPFPRTVTESRYTCSDCRAEFWTSDKRRIAHCLKCAANYANITNDKAVCPQCSVSFKPSWNRRVYCSKVCREDYNTRKGSGMKNYRARLLHLLSISGPGATEEKGEEAFFQADRLARKETGYDGPDAFYSPTGRMSGQYWARKK